MLVTILCHISLLALLGNTVLAQDMSIDPNWRETTNSRSKTDRITIASTAIDRIYNAHNNSDNYFNGIGHWQSASPYSAMAIYDQLTNTTTYKDKVISNIQAVYARNSFDPFGYNDDAMWWAQAAVYGYQKYNDKSLLDMAVATWAKVSKYVITSSNTPAKSFTIAGTCDGVSMNGGVFWRPTADDQSVNSITTGLYMTLSAYLAEITGDSKYKNAATLSAQWILAHNLNANNIVLDTVNGKDCSRSPSNWIFTYNSGKFVEGLSVLAGVTGDSKWTTLMRTVIAAAVKNKPQWQGDNGIITEGSNNSNNDDGIGFKAVYIRGLLAAFRRNPTDAQLCALITAYVNVQYNALLELAKQGSFYSASWPGPAPSTFTSWGQMAALDVLVAVIESN